MRGLPQGLLTETGLKTAKEMDVDFVGVRRRTKRPRECNPHPSATSPMTDLAFSNHVDDPASAFGKLISLSRLIPVFVPTASLVVQPANY